MIISRAGCTREKSFYNTHQLAKFHLKVGKYMPQVCVKLGKSALDALDTTLEAITTPYYNVEEIWDAGQVFEEVDKALKVAKTVLKGEWNYCLEIFRKFALS